MAGARQKKTVGTPAVSLSAQGLLQVAMRCVLGMPLLMGAGDVLAAPFGSAQWINQATAAAAGKPAAVGQGGSGSIGLPTAPGRVVSPEDAQKAAQKSIYNLTRAAQAIMAARDAQSLAHQQAVLSAQGLVPDGLGDDGLLPSAQAADDVSAPLACAATNSCTWQNAGLPQQTLDHGRATVTVTQTAKKAILTWDSFNVGANTTLHFDQHLGTQADGNNDWIALNRVSAGASPSRILGQLRAEGSVYLINPNGIIFGGSSQVDVHSLMASSLPLYLPKDSLQLLPGDDPDYLQYSNQLFLNSGITSVGSNAAAGNILGLNSGQNVLYAGNELPPGDVSVEKGAAINVSKLGYALLAAPDVSNAGSIRATDGQVILAAGIGVALKNAAGGSLVLQPVLSGRVNDASQGNADKTWVGKLTNTGVIEAARGDVRLLGAAVEQDGVVAATSSISRPGSIVMSAMDEQAVDSARARTGSLVLAAGSTTAILPDGNGETTISSPQATADFKPGSILLTGAAVTLRSSAVDAGTGATLPAALVEAPGQNVVMAAVAQNDANIAPRAVQDGSVTGRVYLGEGATVDVAGIADDQLDMAVNYITIPRLGLNELADSPLQRDSILFGAAVVIDSRVSGTRDDGVQWVGSPLANLNGYVQQTKRDINRMLVNGGNITLAGSEVIQRHDAVLNLDAGFAHFVNNGNVPLPTRLVTATGTMVGIGQADPNLHYVGFAGKTVSNYSRWNISTVATDPLGTGGRNTETDYIEGGNAGQLTVFAASALLLDGTISGQTFDGRRQVANGKLPLGGKLVIGPGSDSALLNRVYPDSLPVLAGRSYRIVEDASDITAIASSDFGATSALPGNAYAPDDPGNWELWQQISARKIRSGGFSFVSITADDPAIAGLGGEVSVDSGVNFAVAPGGSISLSGSRITVDGNIKATAGSIALTATGRTDRVGTSVRPDAGTTPVAGNISLGANATLDASGEWVNDAGRSEDNIVGAAFINGGSVTLRALQAATANTAPDSTPGQNIDTTGAIRLFAGSSVDVSSGGRILPGGAMAGGEFTPTGRGGSIALQTYVPADRNFGDVGAPPVPTLAEPPHSGYLQLDGTLSGFGFSGGGTLSLRTPGLQIGGNANPAASWNLVLPEAFFAHLGFDTVMLQSEYNALITDNTQLILRQQSFIPDLDKLRSLGTGQDLASSGAVSTGLRNGYYRAPLNLSVYAGDYVNWITNNFGTPNYVAAGIDGAMTLGANASIIADPGAAITLGSNTQVTVLGSITAHGGSITLTGDTGNGGYAQQPGAIGTAYTSDSKSVWLGADSLLDTSGIALLDPLPSSKTQSGNPARTGRVLDGGTVTLTNDTGYIIALSCVDVDPGCVTGHKATINVSGTHALLDIASSGSYGASFGALDVGSNAGTIRLGAGKGLFFNGSLIAKAGNDQAEGGTLLVTPENPRIRPSDGSTGASRLEVFDHALQMPLESIDLVDDIGPHGVAIQKIDATAPLLLGDSITGTPYPFLTADWQEVDVEAGALQFSASLLQGSGISTLRLGSDPLLNTAQIPVPVVFTDNTGIHMTRELSINASVITATPPQTVEVIPAPPPAPGDDPGDPTVNLLDVPISVNLGAPYVRLTGLRFGGNYSPLTDDLRFGDKATLAVSASVAMDIGGQIRMDNWSSVGLTSAGDMRFITPSTYAYLGDPANVAKVLRAPGLLETTADLNLTAAQIYPATDERFIIQAHPTYRSDYTVTFVDGEEQDSDLTDPVFVRGAVSFNRFGNKAAPALPLSVGGSLVVDARRINQNGVLRAPGGQIVLGLGTLAQENNSAWDMDALQLLNYTALDNFGDAATVQLHSVLTTKTYSIYKGKETELVDSEARTDLPLVAAESVIYGRNSETSVSLDGLVVPYGVTVDGANLRYNGSTTSAARAASSSPDITSAPAKRILSIADTVDVQTGAVIDLSGGGTLQAQEWVAGTGGSRDVLAATTPSYAGGATAVQIPQYADGRALYAVIPNYSLALAPYDPELVQSPLAGKTVWLSGGNGLPAGMYTLLPARYATLPGAFRVVQDARLGDFNAARNMTLPDGTQRMSGHFADSFSGASDARDSAFLVQGGNVWQRYSEYRLTDLNTYFADPSRSATADWAPHDAGQLALQADLALSLKGRFLTVANGGLGAELDVAAPAVQVLDSAGTPLNGYVQLDAATLDNAGFSRLVLGGISTRGNGVDVIKVTAGSVDIATATTPLQAADIVAVAQSIDAGDGVRVETGSRIQATGTGSVARVLPIQLGVADDSLVLTDGTSFDSAGYNGGGALLRVSNSDGVAVNRVNTIDEQLGALRLGENVQLSGRSVNLDSTGAMNIDPSLLANTAALALSSGSVTFSDTPSLATSATGLTIGHQLFSSFSNIGSLSVQSRGAIVFSGDISIATRNSLTLNANVLETDGFNVTLDAPTLTLGNAAGTVAPATLAGGGSLHIITGDLNLGAGTLKVDQAALVDVSASNSIMGTGTGTLDLGAATVKLHTPLLGTGTGANTQITTAGALAVDQAGLAETTTTAASGLGGKIVLNGGNLLVDTTVSTPSGLVGLSALGNVRLGEHATVSAAGISRPVYAITQNTAGGAISIQSLLGNVGMANGAALDISGGAGVAQGGVLGISANFGDVALLGSIKGAGDTASDGAHVDIVSHSLSQGLDDLGDRLMQGGVHGGVGVSVSSGNLALSAGHVLKAHDIRLFNYGGSGKADSSNGNVTIDGTLDASGHQGGLVWLGGGSNVAVNGSIDAHGTAVDQRGGDIRLEAINRISPAAGVNADYGYENVGADSAAIHLGSTALLDVSGGSAGGLSGGTIHLRAPLLQNGDVNVDTISNTNLRGAREVSLEAFAIWDTRDSSSGAHHFDGIVDPAGLFGADGVAAANADHAAFYTTTLRDFVQQPGFAFTDRFGALDGFVARAGISLNNIDTGINHGDVSVLSAWNLGAGTQGSDGLLTLDYRTRGYYAPVIRLNAAHDVQVAASLSDGFFQTVNPFGSSTDNAAAPLGTVDNPLPLAAAALAGYTRDAQGNVATVDSSSFVIHAGHDIRLSGHQQTVTNPDVVEGRVIVAPTMIRTGTGSIDLNAGHDVVLADTVAPGVIYTAGHIVSGTSPLAADTPLVDTSSGLPAFIDTGLAHSEGAGDIRLVAVHDVLGFQAVVDASGAITGTKGTNLAQFWWPWMQRACIATDDGCGDVATASSINFGMFDQGLMSIGGNISVQAGNKVRDLSISLPVTWALHADDDGNVSQTTYGGGNLSMFAGNGISSGSWFLGKGHADIRTFGAIDADVVDSSGDTPFLVGTQIGLQDASVNVIARSGINIDGIHNPSYLYQGFDSQNYSAQSSVSLNAMAGRIIIGNEVARPGEAYGTTTDSEGVLQRAYDYLLPATLEANAYGGSILMLSKGELYPSATGQLSLVAQDDVVLTNHNRENNTLLGLIDADASLLPSPLNPVADSVRASFIEDGVASRFDLHLPTALHLHDSDPLRIYSLDGSVIDSNQFTLVEGLIIASPKPADIRAGKDIINLAFTGQNLYESDITTISAGRDIIDTPLAPGYSVPFIELGGPGVLAVQAGRNIGPLTSTNDAYQFGYLPRLDPAYPGIRTVANEKDAWLPRTGASISIDFGTGPGVNYDAFAARYLDPSVPLFVGGPKNGLRQNTGTADYSLDLMNFVQQFLADQAARDGSDAPGALTPEQAWVAFQAMPDAQRRYFAGRKFLSVLNMVGIDSACGCSGFACGYEAINVMFPAALGYTKNSLGGFNGAQTLTPTGYFDMRGSVVQTQHGGDVSILGPGGSILVGSASAPPTIPATGASAGVGPSSQGILTLEKGDIGIFTDVSVLLAQSRIFTEQGGDLLIWSSNGDINAGKGAKTSTEVPPAEYLCDPEHFCLVDAKSQVSGAGIAVLQTRQGDPEGSATLVAPRGTVDAGDAGIRVSGNLTVAALHVANADNIKTGGVAVGVPTGAVDASVASAGGSNGAIAAKVGDSLANTRRNDDSAAGILSVDVVDYGDADCDARKKRGKADDCPP
jgi:filamentous hemagglutinin family protein